ncbi:MAG: hypothetical protein PUB24_00215 [Lachnospiraceae bacterium]|nr:hypothetical protein [Lachnospiraceae bacterium]MDD6191490.1 hypothetical protein [Lachnospiraceae bacterium]
MRIWFKQWKDSRMITDLVVEDDSAETRTHKVFHALEKACYEMDLGRPIWLDVTVRDFKSHAKARFTKDCFMEEIPFDFLEIEVLEED